MKAAIYVKNANEEQIAKLRTWVTSQGFTEIMEYKDITLPRHSDGKELGRLFRDAEKHKFDVVFTISLKNIDCEHLMNFLMISLGLKRQGVRLISQAEAWTDMSTEEHLILFFIYSEHVDNELYEILHRSQYKRGGAKKNDKPNDDRDPSIV